MPLLRFGVFELDAESGELRRQGRRVHLAAQSFTVLSILAARAGVVVSREELRRGVWGDDTFVDFDRSLNFCIAVVRTALNDDARSPRFIETLPRRGYRFIADVHVQDDGAVKARGQGQKEKGQPEAQHGNRWRWVWAAAILLLIAQVPAPTRVHSRATAVPAALAAFERGMAMPGDGPGGLRKRVYAFREAARLDPRFGEAEYALGDTYLTLAGKRELPVASALAEAHAAALRAVALEPIAETRQLLGTARLLHGWDWDGARRDFVEAVRLAPGWDSAHVTYAQFLSAAGEDAKAIQLIDRAETLSPSCDLILMDSAAIRYRARRYDEALARLSLAAEFGPPRNTSATDWQKRVQSLKLMIHRVQSDLEAERRDALELVKLNGFPDEEARRFAAGDARKTMAAFYRRSLERMHAAGADRFPPTKFATLHAILGETDTALDWLERAVVDHDTELIYTLRNADFDALRGNARFHAVDARVRGTAARPAPQLLVPRSW